ncbi:MAG: ABC transporter permease [Desulfobacterales bacterium]|nr:ABC transporter permease [Desulfobacterales bacterium]
MPDWNKAMLKYISKRLLLLIPTLFGVVTIVFFMMSLAPGDPARLALGAHATPEAVEVMRQELGLDQPLHIQYIKYLKQVVQLDFGKSIKTGEPVLYELLSRFPATIELSFISIVIATILGILAGIVSATRQNSVVDFSAMFAALVGVSMPVFWLALLLIMVFSVGLNLFPTGGRMNIRLFFEPITQFYLVDSLIYLVKEQDPTYLISTLKHITLPAIALATIPLAVIARVTRSSMLEVVRQDYIRTARAKGLSQRKVIYKHALRNALLPVVTIIGIEFGYNLAGAVLTEEIFSWPGIGRWLYAAVTARDIPAVQGGVILIATVFVLVNLTVDIIYAFINPKIRY